MGKSRLGHSNTMKINPDTPLGQELYELHCLLAALINPQCHFFVDDSGGNLRIEDVKLIIQNLLDGKKSEDN